MRKKHYIIIDFEGNTKEMNLNTKVIRDLFKDDNYPEEVLEHKNKKELLQTISNFYDRIIKAEEE